MLIKKDPDIIKSYFEDSSNMKGGHALEVVFPKDVDELSAFLKDANSGKLPVTISGGGTGTTGSRVPFGGAVISMEKFNRIAEISADKMSASVQTGVSVEDLKNACEEKGLFYTSHPTEKSATVGGTVATNASGSRSFKYGPTRRYVRRLKMVLAGGEVLEIKRGERSLSRDNSLVKLPCGLDIAVPMPSYVMPDVKNAAGYFVKDGMDLIDLFIGQEGTLSVITDIELGLVPKPADIFSCFVFFEKEEDAWDFSREARRLSRAKDLSAGPALDALSIEYFDHNSLDLLRAKGRDLPGDANAAIFFEQEIGGKWSGKVEENWTKLILEHNSSPDETWVAMDDNKQDEFTKLRHAIPECVNEMIKRNGFQKLSADIAVPDDRFSRMMDFYLSSLMATKLEYVIFGHIGESHVHVNILPRSETELRYGTDMLMGFARKGVSLGGTVSAEHGIGKIKHKYLEVMYGKQGILDMARIKKAFDPGCILGLDNIFPKEILR
ncbi:MAG: FAD-binding oxidoreductase [Candidatus Omnitrophota bacterium]